MYQPHLSRKFKLRRFHMEIDRKNGAVLVSMVLEQIGKTIISRNNIFFKVIFLQIAAHHHDRHHDHHHDHNHKPNQNKNQNNNQDSTKVKNRQNIQEKTELIITLT